jgi:AcrR family transcriptional regulator
MAPDPHYPRQDRASQTIERLVDAAERALETQSIHGLELRGVCAAAGVTTGAFYRHFRDKEALLDVLFDRFEAVARSQSALFPSLVPDDADADGVIHIFAASLCVAYAERGGLIRALLDVASQRPAYRDRAALMIDDAARALEVSLQRTALRPAGPAVLAAVAIGFATLDHHLAFGERLYKVPLAPLIAAVIRAALDDDATAGGAP